MSCDFHEQTCRDDVLHISRIINITRWWYVYQSTEICLLYLMTSYFINLGYKKISKKECEVGTLKNEHPVFWNAHCGPKIWQRNNAFSDQQWVMRWTPKNFLTLANAHFLRNFLKLENTHFTQTRVPQPYWWKLD